jgi:hypothetical protein
LRLLNARWSGAKKISAPVAPDAERTEEAMQL